MCRTVKTLCRGPELPVGCPPVAAAHEPFIETTNRKPLLRQSPFGENIWEIRFGPQNRLRVFYSSDPAVPRRVLVEAIGVKNRNRLTVGGQVKYES